MTVTVDIRRMDLARLNLTMMFRIRANLYVFLFLWAIVFVSTRYGGDTDLSLVAVGLATFVMTIVVFLAIAIVSGLFTILGASDRSGVLGRHTFTIEDSGLREVTEANETLNKWSAIHRVLQSGNSIVIQINWYLFHVIPRRGFDTTEQYQAFFEQCMAHWKAASR